MKNIYEILKNFGVAIPEDKKAEFDKLLYENYKTVKEVEGITTNLSNVEKERDEWHTKYDADIKQRDTDLANLKSQLETAGTDANKLSDLQSKFDTLQTTYDNAKNDFAQQFAKQAYKYAIENRVNQLKFSSNAAKRAFLSEVLDKNLTMNGDDVLGFDDFVNAYKTQDAGAFADDKQTPPTPNSKPVPFVSSTGTKPDTQPEPPQVKERPRIW